MPMERVTIRRELRLLIRITRTDRAGISQREAAAQAGNMSLVWWKQIEGGRTEVATAGTLAKMCYAIGVTPTQLRSIGEDHIAELVEARQRLLEVDETPEPDLGLESHLMATPGLTDEQRALLVGIARQMIGGA